MKILYFAHFREKTNIAEETIDLPNDVTNVETLIDWLVERNDSFADAFVDREHVRVAVNQEHVEFDMPVKVDDEIAFFPPMTGG
ncbi:MAG TPA: molybdopterin converting factor subunit 1 [Rhodospirillales bacterium]|jgi:molybdopterin converting factor subunit 1|nr:molybdopterin converting factor subunit 1 [Rhodospirillales bacterium]|tara:strand:+ start:956 stop:1207 length:252 start_codon:yes stop_codon:yes gene_type:complete